MRLGSVGVWSGAFRGKDTDAVARSAAELEGLGFGTLWFPGGLHSAFDVAGLLLAATSSVTVATGILNVYVDAAGTAADRWAALSDAHPDRFLLGIGISHRPMVDTLKPGEWGAPIATMSAYLDELDAAVRPVPAAARAVAALGPKMLDLARTRSWGSHTYLVTPEQTREHRAALGRGPLLAPEQGVVLETDPAVARATARAGLAMYLGLPNYLNSWRRAGFCEDDFASGGSDRLIDALFAWGDTDAVARRVRAHLDAGANHVCLQVLGGPPGSLPLPQLRTLASALDLPTSEK